MNQRLAGKVAVVTGSGRGIGRAIAIKLGQEGASVVVNYRKSAEEAEAVVKDIKQQGSEAVAIQADMSQVAEISQLFDKAVDHFGKLEILVSNAGVEHFGKLEEVTPEEFDRTFAVNTRGQFFAMREAAKRMSDGGRIVCMSSISTTHSVHDHAVYGGSKAANEAFARHLALDLGERGITVNAVAPGATKTDMYDKYVDLYSQSDKPIEEQMKQLSPLGRAGEPQDIANVIAFLVSDEGGWLTGQTIHATGGMG